MTRREFLSIAGAAAAHRVSQPPLIVPVHLVVDGGVKWSPQQICPFWSGLWPQAVRDFERSGIRFETSQTTGDIWRPARREPVVCGLDSGVINVIITDRIPIEWDQGLALAGVTTRYRGCHLCMIALNHAHGHQVPFLSVNTCVHELLHVLMLDIFEDRPRGLWGEAREYRIDWYATLLWLFQDGTAVRKSAQAYLARVRDHPGPQGI